MSVEHEIEHLRRSVPVRQHQGVPCHVRLADIPEPWLGQFLDMLVGSQVPIVDSEEAVAYEADWHLFLRQAERRIHAFHIGRILTELEAGLTPEMREAAPVLDPWCLVRDPTGALCYMGAVSNHPILIGTDRWIITSMLLSINFQTGLGRTFSRWYRLGKLIEPTEAEALRGKPLNPALTPMRMDEVAPWLDSLRMRVAQDNSDV